MDVLGRGDLPAPRHPLVLFVATTLYLAVRAPQGQVFTCPNV